MASPPKTIINLMPEVESRYVLGEVCGKDIQDMEYGPDIVHSAS